MTELNLDEAVRKFKDYCQGNGGFDELDFKEYIIDVYTTNQVREARKDELAKLIFNDDEFATLEEIKNGKSVGGGMIQTELVEDRIKELGEDK